MIIEVCANSYESAINAELGGANRIELCKDLHLDGLTPNYDTAKKTIDKLNIPVFVLIRPREGDFNYSNKEFELMNADIVAVVLCKSALTSPFPQTGIAQPLH